MGIDSRCSCVRGHWIGHGSMGVGSMQRRSDWLLRLKWVWLQMWVRMRLRMRLGLLLLWSVRGHHDRIGVMR